MPARKRPTQHPALLPTYDLQEHLDGVYAALRQDKIDASAKQKFIDLSVIVFKELGFTTSELTAAIHSAYQEVSPVPVVASPPPPPTNANIAGVIMPIRTSTPPVEKDLEDKPKSNIGGSLFGRK